MKRLEPPYERHPHKAAQPRVFKESGSMPLRHPRPRATSSSRAISFNI